MAQSHMEGSPALDAALAPERLVDLTQPLGPRTVLWPGSSPFTAHVEAGHERDDVYVRTLALSEHSGTHLDAPLHFGPGQPSAGELGLATLVRPAVVLDVRDRIAGDAGFTLSRADVLRLEDRDGPIPSETAVLVCTGWDVFVEDHARYAGLGAVPSFPGIAEDAARLIVERGVVGIGIDTLGVDPGYAADFPAHRVTQPAGLWHLEGLVNLGRVPARGAWLVAAALPLVDGSGSPVRAFAVLPGQSSTASA